MLKRLAQLAPPWAFLESTPVLGPRPLLFLPDGAGRLLAQGDSLFQGLCLHLGLHLEKQLLRVDVIHQARVIFIHHSQLVPGGTHVQAAHGCGLLQQDNSKEIVHKDLQDLAKFQRNKCELPRQPDPGPLPDSWHPMCSTRTTPTNSSKSMVHRRSLKQQQA